MLKSIRKNKDINTNLKLKNQSIKMILTMTFSILLIMSLGVSCISTYFVTKSKVKEEFEDSSFQVTQQTSKYIETMLTTVDSTYVQMYCNTKIMSIIQNINIDDKTKASNIDQIEECLSDYATNNTFNIISGITFYSRYGMTSSFPSKKRSVADSDKDFKDITSKSWYKKVINNDGKPYWLAPHEEKLIDGRPESYVSSINTIKDDTGENVLGILKIDIKTSVLNQILRDINIGKSGFIFITDDEGNIISSKNEKNAGKKIEEALKNKINDNNETSFIFNKNGEKYYGTLVKSNFNNWKYVAIVPVKELYTTAVDIQKTASIIALICLIVCLIITFAVSNGISNPLKNFVDVVSQLANGNLKVKVQSYNIKEMNILGQNINIMIDNLRNIIEESRNAADENNEVSYKLAELTEGISVSSNEVTKAVEEITNGSDEQVQNSFECKESSDKLAENINITILKIQEISKESKKSIDTLKVSTKIINDLKEISANNSDVISGVADTISKLALNTKNISVILEKIDDIANQTNLLSLNASIEAARAGEAGKGFAVVAEEIQKLSVQSQHASVEIAEILKDIEQGIQNTSTETNNVNKEFEKENHKVGETITSFDSIRNSMNNVEESINDCISSINEMERQKDLLNKNMENITDVSQRNAAATEEVMATMETQNESSQEINTISKKLNSKSLKLKEVLEKFKM